MNTRDESVDDFDLFRSREVSLQVDGATDDTKF